MNIFKCFYCKQKTDLFSMKYIKVTRFFNFNVSCLFLKLPNQTHSVLYKKLKTGTKDVVPYTAM